MSHIAKYAVLFVVAVAAGIGYGLESDWSKVEACKNQMKSKVLRSVLDAEMAFKTGRYDDAKRHGDQAIADSAGMQRYI